MPVAMYNSSFATCYVAQIWNVAVTHPSTQPGVSIHPVWLCVLDAFRTKRVEGNIKRGDILLPIFCQYSAMPSRSDLPSRPVSPSELFYPPPDARTPTRQNFIPDDLVPAHQLRYSYNGLYPCADMTMRDITEAIARTPFINDLNSPNHANYCIPSFEIGERVRVRRLIVEEDNQRWTRWTRATVIDFGIQFAILGRKLPWYKVRIEDTPRLEEIYSYPFLGELWDGWDDCSRPTLTAQTALEIYRRLLRCLVPEFVFNFASSSWRWEWTPAYIQSPLAESTVLIYYHQLSKAAERHGHHRVDEELDGLIARLKADDSGDLWARVGTPYPRPIHAVWSVPWEKEVVSILKAHDCIVAPEAGF
ncbi:hypothetical protein FA95DRAFT_1538645 [Auriscalpium vulgare]|uniref:Uncharacterized protein n=1 Tax=Auriscalpium vulgare TaxID=40419 RepID=A0ACB8RY87_9AGAM|nr:hypothetical protein FA95DRAFT_1538645 [Auriscalpium vulgare]